jgi:hypothetical protein
MHGHRLARRIASSCRCWRQWVSPRPSPRRRRALRRRPSGPSSRSRGSAGPPRARSGRPPRSRSPKGRPFLDGANTRRFLELNGNPPRDDHYALVSDDWFAIFSFRDSGYVKDDEKLDADALLKTLKVRWLSQWA